MGRRKTLRRNMTVGFSVIIVFFALASVISTIAVRRAGGLFAAYQRTSGAANAIADLQTTVLNVRLNIDEFLTTSKSSDVQEYQRFLADAEAAREQAQERAGEEFHRSLVQIGDLLNDLDGSFTAVVETQTSRESLLRNGLEPQIQALESELENLVQSAVATGDSAATLETIRALQTLMTAPIPH